MEVYSQSVRGLCLHSQSHTRVSDLYYRLAVISRRLILYQCAVWRRRPTKSLTRSTYCSNKRLIATIQGRCIECHWQLSKGLYRMDVGLGLMVGPVECGWPWPASRECPYRNCSNTECHWSHDVMRWWCRPPRKHHWPYYQHRQERVGRPTCP